MKRFFSAQMYREMLAQLRLPALLMGVATVVLSALIPVSAALLSGGARPFAGDGLLDMVPLAGLALAYLYVGPFVLTLRALNFGNSRRASDFYHALPLPRTALFVSCLAAALTWVWATLAATVAVNTALYALFGAQISIASLSIVLIFVAVGSLFMLAATALGMTVTGTTLSNIIVTGLIVCFPRLVMTLFSQTVATGVLNLPAQHAGLFNLQLMNTLFSLLTGLLGEDSAAVFSNIGNIAWTVVSALAVLALGGWLFVRRDSEAADKSAPGPRLQLVYRVCLALVPALCLVPTFFEPVYSTPVGAFLFSRLPALLVLGTLSLLLFCAFELLTTKSWKRLARALPSFGLVVVFTLAFYGLARADVSYEAAFKPAADDISWVRVIQTRSYDPARGDGQTDGPPDYNELLMRRLRVRDAALRRIVSKRLATDPRRQRNLTDHETLALLEVKTVGGRGEYRSIIVTNENKPDDFTQALMASREVQHALLALPTAAHIDNLRTDAFVPDGSNRQAAYEEACRELWDSFTQEYEALTAQERYAYRQNWPRENASTEPTSPATLNHDYTITVTGHEGLTGFTSLYQLNDWTPKTTLKAARLVEAQLRESVRHNVTTIPNASELMLYRAEALAPKAPRSDTADDTAAQPDISEENSMPVATFYQADPSDTSFSKVLACAAPALLRPFDPQAHWFASVAISPSTGSNPSRGTSYRFPLTDQEAQTLQSLQ